MGADTIAFEQPQALRLERQNLELELQAWGRSGLTSL
jgi:hypothetical protein